MKRLFSLKAWNAIVERLVASMLAIMTWLRVVLGHRLKHSKKKQHKAVNLGKLCSSI